MTARKHGAANDGAFEDGLVAPGVHRRLTVAVCWAVSRRATLDSRELYEESFSINEEFREWLLCLEDHPLELSQTVLMVPQNLKTGLRSAEQEDGKEPETDGMLEI